MQQGINYNRFRSVCNLNIWHFQSNKLKSKHISMRNSLQKQLVQQSPNSQPESSPDLSNVNIYQTANHQHAVSNALPQEQSVLTNSGGKKQQVNIFADKDSLPVKQNIFGIPNGHNSSAILSGPYYHNQTSNNLQQITNQKPKQITTIPLSVQPARTNAPTLTTLTTDVKKINMKKIHEEKIVLGCSKSSTSISAQNKFDIIREKNLKNSNSSNSSSRQRKISFSKDSEIFPLTDQKQQKSQNFSNEVQKGLQPTQEFKKITQSFQSSKNQFQTPKKQQYKNQANFQGQKDHRPLSTIRQNSFEDSALNKNSLSMDYSNFSSSAPDVPYMDDYSSSTKTPNPIKQAIFINLNIEEKRYFDESIFSKQKTESLPNRRQFFEDNPNNLQTQLEKQGQLPLKNEVQLLKMTQSQKISNLPPQKNRIFESEKNEVDQGKKIRIQKLKQITKETVYQRNLQNQFANVNIKRTESESDSESLSHSFMSKDLTPSKKSFIKQTQILIYERKDTHTNSQIPNEDKDETSNADQNAPQQSTQKLSNKQMSTKILNEQKSQKINNVPERQLNIGHILANEQCIQYNRPLYQNTEQIAVFVEVSEQENHTSGGQQLRKDVTQELDETVSLDFSKSTQKIQSSCNTFVFASKLEQDQNQTQFKAATCEQRDKLKRQQSKPSLNNFINKYGSAQLQKSQNSQKNQILDNGESSQSEQFNLPGSCERRFTFGKDSLQLNSQKMLSSSRPMIKILSQSNKKNEWQKNLNIQTINKQHNTNVQFGQKTQQNIKPNTIFQNGYRSKDIFDTNVPKPQLQTINKQQSSGIIIHKSSLPQKSQFSPTRPVFKDQKQTQLPVTFGKVKPPQKTSLFGNGFPQMKGLVSADSINRIKEDEQKIEKRNEFILSKLRIQAIIKQAYNLNFQMQIQTPQIGCKQVIEQHKITLKHLQEVSLQTFVLSNYFYLLNKNDYEKVVFLRQNIEKIDQIERKTQNTEKSIKKLAFIHDKIKRFQEKYQVQWQAQMDELRKERENRKKSKVKENISFFSIFNVKRNKYCQAQQAVKVYEQEQNQPEQKPEKSAKNYRLLIQDIIDERRFKCINLQRKTQFLLKQRFIQLPPLFVCNASQQKLSRSTSVFQKIIERKKLSSEAKQKRTISITPLCKQKRCYLDILNDEIFLINLKSTYKNTYYQKKLIDFRQKLEIGRQNYGKINMQKSNQSKSLNRQPAKQTMLGQFLGFFKFSSFSHKSQQVLETKSLENDISRISKHFEIQEKYSKYELLGKKSEQFGLQKSPIQDRSYNRQLDEVQANRMLQHKLNTNLSLKLRNLKQTQRIVYGKQLSQLRSAILFKLQ